MGGVFYYEVEFTQPQYIFTWGRVLDILVSLFLSHNAKWSSLVAS